MHPRAAELIGTLDLEPHPEGGFYCETFRSTRSVTPADGRGPRAAITAIYFLLPAGGASRWHLVTSDETWHFYEGDPVELLSADPHFRGVSRHRLGSETPTHTIAATDWQAARALGDYALMGCTVGPGFDFADFTLLADDAAAAARMREGWPELATLL